MNNVIIIDGHVHIHNYISSNTLLETAISNFNEILNINGLSGRLVTRILFLADTSDQDSLDKFWKFQKNNMTMMATPGQWSLHGTQEECTFLLKRENYDIILITGQQVISQEKLEVLLVGARRPVEDGIPVEELITYGSKEKSILVIIPWGAGKWLGKRGRILKDLIRNTEHSNFFIGDSANRPRFWPRSSIFTEAEENGFRNLPGSDPLPLAKEYKKIGKSGFVIKGDLDLTAPAASLKKMLTDQNIEIHPYVNNATPWMFLKNQLFIRLKKSN